MNIKSNPLKIKADPPNYYFYIEQAGEYLESGDEFGAREIIVRRRNIPSDDPSVHAKWAELCEELGMARQARESYERALKISPDDSEILYHFACLLNETGYYEDSIHYLKKAIKYNPDHMEDSVRYYFLCGKCIENVEISGLGESFQEDESFIIT